MIIHCSQKLAARLPGVSAAPLEETSPLGSWHGHLFTLDRRQCTMFIHDATRYALFLPGLRKEDFAELGERCFRPLYLVSLFAVKAPGFFGVMAPPGKAEFGSRTGIKNGWIFRVLQLGI